MIAAPVIADKYGLWMGGVSNFKSFSKRLMKSVVSVEPTKVLSAILRPRIKSAATKSKILMTVRIVPGENGRNSLSMTEIPLVPPRSSESGKINKTVASA